VTDTALNNLANTITVIGKSINILHGGLIAIFCVRKRVTH